MHIQFIPQDDAGRAVLQAVRDDEDPPLPLDSLVFDAAPLTLTPDLVAVAGALLFADHAHSRLTFDGTVSAATTTAISRVTGLEVSPPASLTAPRDSADDEIRATTLDLGLSDSLPPRAPAGDRASRLRVSASRFHGALFGVKEAVIASNAEFMATRFRRESVLAAAGVLYSKDFLACAIDVSGGVDGGKVSSSDVELCAAIEISLA